MIEMNPMITCYHFKHDEWMYTENIKYSFLAMNKQEACLGVAFNIFNGLEGTQLILDSVLTKLDSTILLSWCNRDESRFYDSYSVYSLNTTGTNHKISDLSRRYPGAV